MSTCPIDPNFSGYANPCSNLPLDGNSQAGVPFQNSFPTPNENQQQNLEKTVEKMTDSEKNDAENTQNLEQAQAQAQAQEQLPQQPPTQTQSNFYKYLYIASIIIIICLLGYFLWRWLQKKNSANSSPQVPDVSSGSNINV